MEKVNCRTEHNLAILSLWVSLSPETSCYVTILISLSIRTLQCYARGRSSFFKMFLSSHKKIVIYMSGGSCTHGFSWGWGTPSLRRTHSYRNLLYNNYKPKPKPRFWYRKLLYNKNYKAKPRFCKALRRFKSVESHPHAGRVKEKPHVLSTNCIQTGRESMPTNGLLSSPKDIMSKPDVVKLCVQKSQRGHVRKLQSMNKKATTHTGDSLTSVTFHPPVWNTSYFAKLTFCVCYFGKCTFPVRRVLNPSWLCKLKFNLRSA